MTLHLLLLLPPLRGYRSSVPGIITGRCGETHVAGGHFEALLVVEVGVGLFELLKFLLHENVVGRGRAGFQTVSSVSPLVNDKTYRGFFSLVIAFFLPEAAFFLGDAFAFAALAIVLVAAKLSLFEI